MSGREDVSAIALFAAAVEHLGPEQSREDLFEHVVRVASTAISDVEHASITLGREQEWVTPAASGPVALALNALQYELDQGPCVEVARSGHLVLVSDITAEPRWPRVASGLAQQSPHLEQVRAMMAVPLRVGSQVTGSLNMSSTRVGAFTGITPASAALFAAMAGLALAAADEREKAAASRAQMDGFAAALAHDLRSGMTVVLGAHGLLADRRSMLDSMGREALDLLDDELTRQRGLLGDLLDLARNRSEQLPVEPILLAPLVREAVQRHRGHVPIQLRPEAALARVALHPAQVRRILANLLDNADRHAGGATAVVVGCTDEHGWVVVEDAGPGIPPWQRERVFTAFGAPSATGEHLGLALCREHVRAVGGELTVDDPNGGGARFRLDLPLADPAATEGCPTWSEQ